MQVVQEQQPHLTLQAYLGQLQQVIKQHFAAPQWVIAELSEFNRRANGHCYLSLIESIDGKEVAKCNATLFANVANLQLKAFRSITGCEPASGMKVLLNVSASLHPQYGFQLQVHNLDGNYTLGEMHARVEQIVLRLRNEGLYDRQRQLPRPSGYWRIAVVSPAQAAGLGDFRRDADRLHQHGLVQFSYYDAIFQGASAADSIKHALRQVYADHSSTPFDAVCLIRGGGAKADLAWLNDYGLAVWVCRIPIPVYTGIGHERDETVLDLVAHTRFDTPSKVIGAVLRHLHQQANELQQVIDRGQAIVASLVADEQARLQHDDSNYRHLLRELFKEAVHQFKADRQRFEAGINRLLHEQALSLQNAQAASQFLTQTILNRQQGFLDQAGARLDALTSQVLTERHNALLNDHSRASHLLLSQVQAEETALHLLQQRYTSSALGLLRDEEHQLRHWQSLFSALDPRAVMAKGFSMVKSADGRVLGSAAAITSGDPLRVQFHDGEVQVTAR